MGSSEADWDAETLGVPHGNIGPEGAGRLKQKKGHGIGNQNGKCPSFFKLFYLGPWISE